jgi:hypothetical protein
MPKKPKAEGAVPTAPKKPRKKKVQVEVPVVNAPSDQPIQFAARKDGVMKMFDTEDEAFEYAEPNSTIASYSTTNGTDFTFVAVVGIKTSADRIGRLLQS